MEWEAQYYEFYHLKLQVKQKFMNVITFKCVEKKMETLIFLSVSVCALEFFLVLATTFFKILSLTQTKFLPIEPNVKCTQ